MNRLAILGASGHGKVVAETAELAGWQEVVFFDDKPSARTGHDRWVVAGRTEDLFLALDNFDGVVVAIGDCQTRWEKHVLLRNNNAPLVTIKHPKSCISSYANVGKGTVIFGGVVINVDVSIGDACIINTGANIDHDSVISDATHIAPGAHLSGNVKIEECSWIGVGATVKQGVLIGTGAVVGAGAVVVGDIPPGITVVGNPAIEIER